jgi:hypothetical protein
MRLTERQLVFVSSENGAYFVGTASWWIRFEKAVEAIQWAIDEGVAGITVDLKETIAL